MKNANVSIKKSWPTKLKKKTSIKRKKSVVFLAKKKNLLVFIIVFALLGSAYLIISNAATDPYDRIGQSKLVAQPARGINYSGLTLVKENANHPCAGIFEVVGVKERKGSPVCTHGPDPSPESVDVTKGTTEERITTLNKQPKKEISTDQIKNTSIENLGNAYVPATGTTFTNPFPESRLHCGTKDKRIELVLAADIDLVGTYPDLATYLMASSMKKTETLLEASSANSGPNSTLRKFRVLTDSNCSPIVKRVKIPKYTYDLSGTDWWSNVFKNLQNAGLNQSDRKYLVWLWGAQTCGMAQNPYSDSPNPGALGGEAHPSLAIIGANCWGTSAEFHELLHTLGAVQRSAPHATWRGHCIDEYDRMCGDDYGEVDGIVKNGTGQSTKLYVSPGCSDKSLDWFADCNKNDYFNTSTTIKSSNYLYNHWNVANSAFLQKYNL